ncbi:NACHT domain-containing protein [Spirulina major CS-329]|uniref:NACHT domain-containing protein n=1 Tax=Spirulina TaxID=1154 RepID=UPI00232E8EDC|nr:MULTISPECIES: NACHT domain-containing protein [Spirulina]MDB9493964.1 NACHT domain-containing protein [Spirulina subsalsa CS-330]MDB9503723.1 NACHT domain-containing protein [Spirulina major CS-329]
MSLTGLALTTLAKETLLPIAQAVLEEVAKSELGQAATGRLEQVKRSVSDQVDSLSLHLTRAIEQYTAKYEKRHCLLKVLGMREPMRLDDVYTNVRFLNESTIRTFASTDALESAFRARGSRRFQNEDCETRVGVEVASETQYLMVLGQPGAGKSTFLRRMGLEAFKGQKGELKQACIPVFLELKRFDSAEIDIQEQITAEFDTCGFPKSEQFVTKALEQGKLLILFDGLDEVPGQYVNGIIDKIQDFVDRHDQNRFIASCRTAAYRSGFRRFKDVIMADFDDAQIKKFIQNWFRGEVDQTANTAEYCWELLRSKGQEGAQELAQTPLLLTFLCLVYDRSQSFSSNRSALYGKAMRILLEEWAAEKRINHGSIYDGLHTDLEELLLSEIAYKNFIEDRLFFEKDDLVNQIRVFLAGNLNASRHLNGEQILDAISIQQGILVERAENIYSFSHLTLQEYLTAQYVVDDSCINLTVEQYLLDKKWREVFLLIASSMGGKGADRFLRKIIETIEKLLEKTIYHERLIPILLWSDTETQITEGTLSLFERRSIANAYVYTYTYANAIIETEFIAEPDNITETEFYSEIIRKFIQYYQDLIEKEPVFMSLDIFTLLEKLNILKQRVSNKEFIDSKPSQSLARTLIQTILNAHHLPREFIELTKEEVKIIIDYYYATYLLIQCKETAVRVSPAAWAAIEERMLRVPAALRPDAD